MSQVKKIGKRMEITPQPERLGGLVAAEKNDEAVTLGQLSEYGGTARYGKYVATLTQSGTDAPVATVLENTLGTVTFSYLGSGSYKGTCVGKFANAARVCIFLDKQQFVNTTIIPPLKEVIATVNDADSFYIETSSGTNQTNGVLSNTAIEIRVYQ